MNDKKIWLETEDGQKFFIIKSERIDMQEELNKTITTLHERIYKAIEYIEKDTRWFDSEYASVYGELCTCAGAKDDRLEVLVNPTNLLNILRGDKDEYR